MEFLLSVLCDQTVSAGARLCGHDRGSLVAVLSRPLE